MNKRKDTTKVVSFLFGMSLRGFSSLQCSLIYTKLGNAPTKRMYINWSLLLQDYSWGKQSATTSLQLQLISLNQFSKNSGIPVLGNRHWF